MLRRCGDCVGRPLPWELTPNDLMLRDLFQVVGSWNGRYEGRRSPWVRITMPVNLRRRDDRALPAANLMGFTFLTRHSWECGDEAALLDGVHRETAAIKGQSLALYFLGGLGLARGVPGLVPWMLRRQCCCHDRADEHGAAVGAHSVAVAIDRRVASGNVVLESVLGVPPIRPLTRVRHCGGRLRGAVGDVLALRPGLFHRR